VFDTALRDVSASAERAERRAFRPARLVPSAGT